MNKLIEKIMKVLLIRDDLLHLYINSLYKFTVHKVYNFFFKFFFVTLRFFLNKVYYSMKGLMVGKNNKKKICVKKLGSFILHSEG